LLGPFIEFLAHSPWTSRSSAWLSWALGNAEPWA